MSESVFAFRHEDGQTLLCQVCGVPIGMFFGAVPDPKIVVARCYQCAAVEEAEAITSEASDV